MKTGTSDGEDGLICSNFVELRSRFCAATSNEAVPPKIRTPIVKNEKGNRVLLSLFIGSPKNCNFSFVIAIE